MASDGLESWALPPMSLLNQTGFCWRDDSQNWSHKLLSHFLVTENWNKGEQLTPADSSPASLQPVTHNLCSPQDDQTLRCCGSDKNKCTLFVQLSENETGPLNGSCPHLFSEIISKEEMCPELHLQEGLHRCIPVSGRQNLSLAPISLNIRSDFFFLNLSFSHTLYPDLSFPSVQSSHPPLSSPVPRSTLPPFTPNSLQKITGLPGYQLNTA